MWHPRPPRDPLPFMANTILNFHFNYPQPSLIMNHGVAAVKDIEKNWNIITAIQSLNLWELMSKDVILPEDTLMNHRSPSFPAPLPSRSIRSTGSWS